MPAGRPMAKEGLQPGERGIRKSKLQPEYYREKASDRRPYHTRNQKLLGNDLMILAKNIFSDKRFVVMYMYTSVLLTYRYSNSMRCLPLTQWLIYFVTHDHSFYRNPEQT